MWRDQHMADARTALHRLAFDVRMKLQARLLRAAVGDEFDRLLVKGSAANISDLELTRWTDLRAAAAAIGMPVYVRPRWMFSGLCGAC